MGTRQLQGAAQVGVSSLSNLELALLLMASDAALAIWSAIKRASRREDREAWALRVGEQSKPSVGLEPTTDRLQGGCSAD
jgi:hypothetical protein